MSSETYKTAKAELITNSIFHLEFYKKQKNWKFCNDVRKQSKIRSKQVSDENKCILNKTYDLAPLDTKALSSLNVGFIDSSADKPTKPVPHEPTKPKLASHRKSNKKFRKTKSRIPKLVIKPNNPKHIPSDAKPTTDSAKQELKPEAPIVKPDLIPQEAESLKKVEVPARSHPNPPIYLKLLEKENQADYQRFMERRQIGTDLDNSVIEEALVTAEELSFDNHPPGVQSDLGAYQDLPDLQYDVPGYQTSYHTQPYQEWPDPIWAQQTDWAKQAVYHKEDNLAPKDQPWPKCQVWPQSPRNCPEPIGWEWTGNPGWTDGCLPDVAWNALVPVECPPSADAAEIGAEHLITAAEQWLQTCQDMAARPAAALLELSCDSRAFMEGAHVAPHSSELDIRQVETSMSSLRVCAGVRYHTEALRKLLKEASVSPKSEPQDPYEITFEEFPTRDVGLNQSSSPPQNDILLAGSYKNDPMYVIEGPGTIDSRHKAVLQTNIYCNNNAGENERPKEVYNNIVTETNSKDGVMNYNIPFSKAVLSMERKDNKSPNLNVNIDDKAGNDGVTNLNTIQNFAVDSQLAKEKNLQDVKNFTTDDVILEGMEDKKNFLRNKLISFNRNCNAGTVNNELKIAIDGNLGTQSHNVGVENRNFVFGGNNDGFMNQNAGFKDRNSIATQNIHYVGQNMSSGINFQNHLSQIGIKDGNRGLKTQSFDFRSQNPNQCQNVDLRSQNVELIGRNDAWLPVQNVPSQVNYERQKFHDGNNNQPEINLGFPRQNLNYQAQNVVFDGLNMDNSHNLGVPNEKVVFEQYKGQLMPQYMGPNPNVGFVCQNRDNRTPKTDSTVILGRNVETGFQITAFDKPVFSCQDVRYSKSIGQNSESKFPIVCPKNVVAMSSVVESKQDLSNKNNNFKNTEVFIKVFSNTQRNVQSYDERTPYSNHPYSGRTNDQRIMDNRYQSDKSGLNRDRFRSGERFDNAIGRGRGRLSIPKRYNNY